MCVVCVCCPIVLTAIILLHVYVLFMLLCKFDKSVFQLLTINFLFLLAMLGTQLGQLAHVSPADNAIEDLCNIGGIVEPMGQHDAEQQCQEDAADEVEANYGFRIQNCYVCYKCIVLIHMNNA